MDKQLALDLLNALAGVIFIVGMITIPYTVTILTQ